MIRPVQAKDIQSICNIYNYYIKNTTITFEENPVNLKEMQNRIESISANYPYLVIEENNEIKGYAYACQWKSRSAYRFSAELTIYLHNDFHGKGSGTALYEALIEELKKTNTHLLVGVITFPNPSSENLHKKLGFNKAAHIHEAGYKFNKWLDVSYWERIL